MDRKAVFTRNDKKTLEEACNREGPTAFQSKVKWAEAQRSLKKQKTLKVYIAQAGEPGEPKVMYDGTITEIAFVDSAPEAANNLLAAHGVEKECWGKTVYLVSGCGKIPEMPLSALRLAKNGTPLSDNYNYSYSIVLEHDAKAVT